MEQLLGIGLLIVLLGPLVWGLVRYLRSRGEVDARRAAFVESLRGVLQELEERDGAICGIRDGYDVRVSTPENTTETRFEVRHAELDLPETRHTFRAKGSGGLLEGGASVNGLEPELQEHVAVYTDDVDTLRPVMEIDHFADALRQRFRVVRSFSVSRPADPIWLRTGPGALTLVVIDVEREVDVWTDWIDIATAAADAISRSAGVRSSPAPRSRPS